MEWEWEVKVVKREGGRRKEAGGEEKEGGSRREGKREDVKRRNEDGIGWVRFGGKRGKGEGGR